MNNSSDSPDIEIINSNTTVSSQVGTVEKQTNAVSVTSVKPTKKIQRYRQAYRVEWESRPDFKGWLKGVPGEPTRAYCLYCNRSLHAHCLSLLKHLCTLKHTRAAEAATTKKQNTALSLEADIKTIDSRNFVPACNATSANIVPSCHGPNNIKPEKNKEVQQNLVDNSGGSGIETACQQTTTTDRVSVEQNTLSTESSVLAAQKQTAASEMSTSQGPKKGISTHILDTAKGKPATGLQVSLYRLIDGKWTFVSEGCTDANGRFSNFLQGLELFSGRYKLHFDVDRYFELTNQESLYPFIEIVFDVKQQQEHYHIPLLLSPFGYTTYRGS